MIDLWTVLYLLLSKWRLHHNFDKQIICFNQGKGKLKLHVSHYMALTPTSYPNHLNTGEEGDDMEQWAIWLSKESIIMTSGKESQNYITILTEITNLFFKQESISFISIMLFIKFINFIMSKVIVTW